MEFESVDNRLKDVLEILESRLPESASIHNVAKQNLKWKEEQRWYSLGPLHPESLILVSMDKCGDNEYFVSADKTMEITTHVKQAFESTPAISWDDSFVFCGIDMKISALVVEIGTRVYGNDIRIHPCRTFTMSREKAKTLPLEQNLGEATVVDSISNSNGVDFIQKTWKYASDHGRPLMEKIFSRNITAGVYVENEIVSGVGLSIHGAIGMLYTLEEHRGKGYARATMHRIMRQCADEGFVPCCFVEMRNKASMEFQRKLGFDDLAIEADFVAFSKSAW